MHHDSPQQVSRLLQSLQTVILPPKTEILIANNGKKNSNQKISQKFSNQKFFKKIKFFQIKNRGYPAGNNFLAHKSSAEFLAFVNPDILVRAETFSVLLKKFSENSKIGLISPRLEFPDGKIFDNFRRWPKIIDLIIKRNDFLREIFKNRMKKYLMWDKDPKISEPVDWTTGAFQIIPRNIFQKIGGHNEKYFLFFSDVEICKKIWQHGFQVFFCAETVAIHDKNRLSSGGFFDIFRKKNLRIHISDAVKYFFGKTK